MVIRAVASKDLPAAKVSGLIWLSTRATLVCLRVSKRRRRPAFLVFRGNSKRAGGEDKTRQGKQTHKGRLEKEGQVLWLCAHFSVGCGPLAHVGHAILH